MPTSAVPETGKSGDARHLMHRFGAKRTESRRTPAAGESAPNGKKTQAVETGAAETSQFQPEFPTFVVK